MLRDRLRELFIYFRRRKPNAGARQTATASPPVIPADGRRLGPHLLGSIHSFAEGSARNTDLFDLFLGLLVIGYARPRRNAVELESRKADRAAAECFHHRIRIVGSVLDSGSR
jgi:hypothetical protein